MTEFEFAANRRAAQIGHQVRSNLTALLPGLLAKVVDAILALMLRLNSAMR